MEEEMVLLKVAEFILLLALQIEEEEEAVAEVQPESIIKMVQMAVQVL
jgi:hypothetical protein